MARKFSGLMMSWVAAALLAGSGAGCAPRAPETRWTMIDVSAPGHQADCHLLELADGSSVVIDPADGAGAGGTALAFLKRRGVERLRLVVISHFHRDHYGRLLDFINAGIRVDHVVMNLPGDRRIADREMPWGCDWDEVQAVLQFLREKGIPYHTPKAGERLIEVVEDGVTTAIDVVCLYDGVNTPVGETDINDTSILVRFTHGKTRALFTGDLNLALGTYLATSEFDLKADILKVPHHGTEGVAPNEFFNRVGARTALVPAPRDLWLSIRSKRVRDFFEAAGAAVFINGIHGDVTVRFTSENFSVETDRGAETL